MDAKAGAVTDLSAALATTNEQMATVCQQEAIKLLGQLVKDAFNHERLSF